MTRRLVATDALLLRAVPYRDTDVIATWLTETDGKLSTMIRGGRSSRRRVNGALDIIHGVFLRAEDRGTELLTLKEAVVKTVRLHVTESLDALETAGTALRWTRHVCPARTPEPEVYRGLVGLLDHLEREPARRELLLRFGLELLRHVGYELLFGRCASCARARPEGRSAHVDPGRGGVVCRSCGGGGSVLDDALLLRFADLASGADVALSRADADTGMRLVTQAMATHTDFEASR